MSQAILESLVDMSRYLGHPDKMYAILGEGNTSARVDEDTFYVKASGTTLATIDYKGFVSVSISKVTGVLTDPSADDEAVTKALKTALSNPGETRRPSVETILHALLLQYPEINFIGHTHPTYTNMLLCSNRAEEAAAGRICPDHIVVMGHKSVYVPYVDPGLVLAREVKKQVELFIEQEGVLPKAIMMQNHGLFALGTTAAEVKNITDMAEKISRILVGSYGVGGPRFLSDSDVNRIYTRPDEKYRQQAIGVR